MNSLLIREAMQTVLRGGRLEEKEALKLINLPLDEAPDLVAAAHRVRLAYKGKTVRLCAIVNAKSGRCGEDCAFCAQSSHYRTAAAVYPLLPAEEILSRARQAASDGACGFGIVTSGVRIRRGDEWQELLRAVRLISLDGRPEPHASLGLLTPEQAQELRAAGATTYHHNLETAPSFFPSICTTHPISEDFATIRAAKGAGLAVCCGGILGLGETPAQRVELALTLRELEVDSVPLNFLNPIPGTPLENRPLLPAWEAIKAVAVFRLLLPDKDIRLCGGKERTLRQLLPLALLAGANGLMTGNYLTTSGRQPELDRELVADLGFELVS